MAANVLYFGPDEWSRVRVLKNAGYMVRECGKLQDLESALNAPPPPDAVMVSGAGRFFAHPAVEIVHAKMALAPVIIFPSQDEPAFEKSVDLVVPPLTRPTEWLQELADLIEKSRGLREDAISLHERSTTLIRQSVAIRSKSAADRASSAILREDTLDQRQKARTLHNGAEKKFNSKD